MKNPLKAVVEHTDGTVTELTGATAQHSLDTIFNLLDDVGPCHEQILEEIKNDARTAPSKFDKTKGIIELWDGYIQIYWSQGEVTIPTDWNYFVHTVNHGMIGKKRFNYIELKWTSGWKHWKANRYEVPS